MPPIKPQDEEVFRFSLLRPAFKREFDLPQSQSIDVTNSSPSQLALNAARLERDSDAIYNDLNNPVTEPNEFVFKYNNLNYTDDFLKIANAIRTSDWEQKKEYEYVVKLIESTFSIDNISDLLNLDKFDSDKTKIQNTIYFSAIYKGHRKEQDKAILIVRTINLIELVANSDVTVRELFSSQENFCRTVLYDLPIVIPSISVAGTSSSEGTTSAIMTEETGEDDVLQLENIQLKLETLPPTEFYEPPTPTDPWEQVFGSIKESALTSEEHTLLTKYQLDFKTLTVQQLVERIVSIISSIKNVEHTNSRKIVMSGHSILHKLGSSVTISAAVNPIASHASNIKSVGVADLLVVEQHIKRYERGEIAHIENIMQGEKRERKHTRKETTETEVTLETESISEEERDTQTTDRMEVKREVSSIVKEESSLKAGASLSASYGPSIEFKTYVDGATSSSSEEAHKQGISYSSETINRAISNISERVLQKRRSKHIIELIDANTHSFEAKGGGVFGTDNRSGIYQWVDKVYQSQIMNYGKRVIYDILVPEPAAGFIYALFQGADERPLDLVKPEPFDVPASSLTPNNYQKYVVKYGVTDATPPPEPYRHVVKTFTGSQQAPNQSQSDDGTLTIPSDYEGMFGRATATMAVWTAAPSATLDFQFGQNTWRRQNNGVWSSPRLNFFGHVGDLATTYTAVNAPSYSMGFDAYCKVSPGGLSRWQNKIHSQIYQRYLEVLQGYERKLEEFSESNLTSMFGRSPEENRTIERVEIKKMISRIFLGKDFDYGSIFDRPADFPDVDVAKLSNQEKEIRFFEQAFEWEQLQYRFYPYYWGRKNTWLDKILNRDQDPLFRDFLRSGAARTVISVRPGFEEPVAHYFLTGEVWSGGDLPDITDPNYLPILKEIKESQGQTESSPYGNPWEYKVPTNLVIINEDNDLPKWKKGGAGGWEPEN